MTDISTNSSRKEFPQEVDFDVKSLKITSLDIEVACENEAFLTCRNAEPLLSIEVQDYNTRKIKVWGTKPYKTDRKDVEYILCDGEEHLLRCFLNYWTVNFPDILTGWNVELYDVPYICGRLERLFGERDMKQMSPWGIVHRGRLRSRSYKYCVQHVWYQCAGLP